jgi:hypothetical protein
LAVVTWITDLQGQDLNERFQPLFEALDLQLQELGSTALQLYAEDRRDAPIPVEARVKVLVSWLSQHRRDCQVEVRSSEAQLRSNTRCQVIADQLRSQLPPRAA